jgi:hypothetical protein
MNAEGKTESDTWAVFLNKIRMLVINQGHHGVNWELVDHSSNNYYLQCIRVYATTSLVYMANLITDELILVE